MAVAASAAHQRRVRRSSTRLMLALGLIATLLAATTAVHAEPKYLGCYRDAFAASDRDLGGMVALEEGIMTPGWCESLCGARHGYKYFGVQYGAECWCGNEYGKHGAVDESKCNTPCSGDASQRCGGELANSVFEVRVAHTPLPRHRDGRPLIGLVMIVKNESHTLPTTLLAIKPWIDVYYILDTGSTDGTQDAIRRTLGADKGEVWEEPFIDYGRSRNRALDIAASSKNLGGPPVFSLMLSADETVHNGAGLRAFCEEHRDRIANNEEAYYVQMDVGWRFDSARLSRTDKTWRYVGRVHEYLAPPAGRGSPSLRVPRTYIKFKVTDHERRSKREFQIRDILLQEVAEKPTNTRASFYLARTYNVLRNHSAALAEFERRVSLGGWREEVYESLYAIGWQKNALQRPWHEVQQAFLDAHAHSPERAEPLYAVASHWYREKKPSLAYLFASHGASLPYPSKATLWVQADVYAWQCLFLVGMTGLDLGKEREGAAALIKAMAKRPQDKTMQQQADKYRAKLGEDVYRAIQCEVNPATCAPGQKPTQSATVTQVVTAPVSSRDDWVARSGAVSDASSSAAGGGSGLGALLPLLYAFIGFLLVCNVLLLVALRRGKSAPACIPHGLLNLTGPDKQV